jgi:hypothetical protein
MRTVGAGADFEAVASGNQCIRMDVPSKDVSVWSVGDPATEATLTEVQPAGALQVEAEVDPPDVVVDEDCDDDEQAARDMEPTATTTSARAAPDRRSQFQRAALSVFGEPIELSSHKPPSRGATTQR